MKNAVQIFLFLLAIFLFSRLAFIKNSFFYLNDMGRDSLVLLDWQKTGKPPLLGPQTSALPFNQSAFYFYILYPSFLLTNGSPYAALFTVNIFYIVVLSLTFWLVYKMNQKDVMTIFLLSLLGIIFHPQYIIQNRFVWNPSFVGPLLLASFFLFYLLTQHFSWKKVIALGMTLALAVSLSYSVAPVLFGFGIASLVYLKKKSLLLGTSLASWLFFFNIPTLFFELRHHFLLTQMMLHQEKVKQVGIDFQSKITGLLNFAFTTYPASLEVFLGVFFISLMIFGCFFYFKKDQKTIQLSAENKKLFEVGIVIFVTGLLTTLLSPVPVLAHYVFGLVTIGIVLLAALPGKMRYLVFALLICVWSYPIFSNEYFKDAPRTVSQMESCYSNYCKTVTAPIFVSMQSGLLPFHNGPEHRYLLKKAGCDVKDIETDPAGANEMAVAVESSEFTFGKTSYAELTAFHPTQMLGVTACQPNLQVVTLKR